MTLEVGEVVREAFDRVTTPAGAVLALVFAVVGTLRAIGQQDAQREASNQLLAELESFETEDESVAQFVQEMQVALEEAQSDLPLALGLDQGAATALWFVAFVAGLVVLAIAVDAIARDVESPGELGAEGLGWKTINLLLGGIAYLLAFVIGLAFLILPGIVVAVVFAYFPIAIALDDEWFGSAFGSSLDVVRGNVVETLLLVVTIVVAYFAAGFVGGILGAPLPEVAGAVLAQVFTALAWLFTLALLTTAYVAARDPEERSARRTLDDEWTAEDESV